MNEKSKSESQLNQLVVPLIFLVVVLVGSIVFWFAVIEPMRERTAANRLKTHEIMAGLEARLDERQKFERTQLEATNHAQRTLTTVTDTTENYYETPQLAPGTQTMLGDDGEYHGSPTGQ